jgi:hypothetical protein
MRYHSSSFPRLGKQQLQGGRKTSDTISVWTLLISLTLQLCMQDAGRKTSEKDTSAEFR